MHEAADDLAELQRVLDESHESAGEHLRGIFAPARRASAADVVAKLQGVFMINLATVTARSEPLVAPVDGLFFHGRLWFSLPPGAVRARHLLARPQVSASYVEGDPGACLIVHGTAIHVDAAHPSFVEFDEFARGVYGAAAIAFAQQQYKSRTGPDFTGFIEPRRMYAQDFPKAT